MKAGRAKGNAVKPFFSMISHPVGIWVAVGRKVYPGYHMLIEASSKREQRGAAS